MSADVRKNRRDKAARLLVDGSLSERQISAACRIDARTLTRWKHEPEFREKVEELTAATAQGATVAAKGLVSRPWPG